MAKRAMVPAVRVTGVGDDRRRWVAMIHNWPLMAARGGLAALFGLALLISKDTTLATVVTLFGVYAIADGILALVAAGRGRLRMLEAWPVALEGAVSVALGALALTAPMRASREFITTLALWGIATGIVELVYARRWPRTMAASWFMVAAGASSLFLAGLLLTLPYADVPTVASVVAVYALVFGVTFGLGAYAVARGGR